MSTAATRCRCASEVDLDIFSIESLVDNPPAVWIEENLGKGARLGFDPWLHTIGEVKALQASADKVGAVLVPLDSNPIDIIWKDQPEPPLAPVEIHPIGFAGELAKDKLARLAAAIAKEGATHAVLTDPSSIAWAFNIRGGDVPHTPLALGFRHPGRRRTASAVHGPAQARASRSRPI